mmetsp:Transcript_232/g.747  ORF Transcript_232/g.747 Transcript_232/m.747 type:complete len:151 (-) Transcript_232:48-500(-)
MARVSRALLPLALGLAAALAAAPPDPVASALSTDDECEGAGPGQCGLNALQHRAQAEQRVEQAAATSGRRPEWTHHITDYFDANITKWQDPNADWLCSSWTGGTCAVGSCNDSRGPTECSGMRCLCQEGYCSRGGKCITREQAHDETFGR